MKDSRTLLPVRNEFYKTVQPLLEQADIKQSEIVLLVIDIDGVDFVLRTFGPTRRDALIREVGHRIQTTAGNDNTPYHITQGRFAVVLVRTSYPEATEMARQIVKALREPIDVAGIPYRLTVNAGISHYPNHSDNLDELVRTAVFACHQARQAHTDYASFDSAWDDRERYRFRLMVDLEHAIEDRSAIRLAYQPLVDFDSGECSGMETLCRWQHEEYGFIPPGHFLPFVEQTSLMMPLTEAIVGQGLDDLVSLQRQGFEGRLSINLSPSLFRQPDLMDRLLEQFRYFNISSEHIDFEVTETGIMEQPDTAVKVLTAFREWGSHVSIDDFGTGHSSLAYLADLPIDTIKIDRHFIRNLDFTWGEAIVSAAATLADKLGLTTVAEGIEEDSQYCRCHNLGITQGQGFHIGKPMFRNDFHGWLGAEDSNLY